MQFYFINLSYTYYFLICKVIQVEADIQLGYINMAKRGLLHCCVLFAFIEVKGVCMMVSLRCIVWIYNMVLVCKCGVSSID